MLAHDVFGDFCECPTSSGCLCKKTLKNYFARNQETTVGQAYCVKFNEEMTH